MNYNKFDNLMARSGEIEIDNSITAEITSSTLSLKALKIIGSICRNFGPKNVLEFGSGLSTRFLCEELYLIHGTKFKLLSIDDSEQYLERTRRSIEKLEKKLKVDLKECVRLVHAPIKKYVYKFRIFLTYDPGIFNYNLNFLPEVDFMLIDGPLGWRFGREAPLYLAGKMIRSDSIIVLDDAARPPEQEALRNWSSGFQEGIHHIHYDRINKGLSIICLPNNKLKRFPFGCKTILRSWGKVTINKFKEYL